MKIFRHLKSRSPLSSSAGFTLVEMMMVVGIFLFIFVGVMVGVQIFGLRIYTLEATKLVATQGARTVLNAMRDNIRQGKTVYVGNCSSIATNTFTLLGATNLQEGNAVIVYPATNMNYYSVYYLDTNTTTNTLTDFTVSNNAITYTQPLAQYITNNIIFFAENCDTTIPTNYTSLGNREIIHIRLQFSQWEYPIAYIGSNSFNAFDYYQLNSRIFRRAWN
jgi:type II secretory pathway pseudopilin PulG